MYQNSVIFARLTCMICSIWLIRQPFGFTLSIPSIIMITWWAGTYTSISIVIYIIMITIIIIIETIKMGISNMIRSGNRLTTSANCTVPFSCDRNHCLVVFAYRFDDSSCSFISSIWWSYCVCNSFSS